MINNKEKSLKLIATLLITIYMVLFPISAFSNSVVAFLTLLTSIALLYKGSRNLPIFIMFFFIFYINYSIIIGEYLVGGSLGAPLFEVKNVAVYGLSIRLLFIFMSIMTLFYKGRTLTIQQLHITPRDNFILFYLTILASIFAFIFGIERGELLIYSVRISPLFEYSKLILLFAYYYSGNINFRKIIITLIIGAFVVQDIMYGGRITSMQLIILYAITIWVDKLTVGKILVMAVLGITFNSLIAVYRSSFSFADMNLFFIINELVRSYFVFDTATFAYYASATHLATLDIVSTSFRFNSFLEFGRSVFFGSSGLQSDLTAIVAKKYFFNMGGGVITSWFYFWFSWIGVGFIAAFITKLINEFAVSKSDFCKIMLFSIIVNTPRWFLYSPNQLFRGSLFFVTILWILYQLSELFLDKYLPQDVILNYLQRVKDKLSRRTYEN